MQNNRKKQRKFSGKIQKEMSEKQKQRPTKKKKQRKCNENAPYENVKNARNKRQNKRKFDALHERGGVTSRYSVNFTSY